MDFKKFILAGAVAATALGASAQNLPAPDAQSAILAQQSQSRLLELSVEPIPTLQQRSEMKATKKEKADILSQFAETAPQADSPILAKIRDSMEAQPSPTLSKSQVQEASFNKPNPELQVPNYDNPTPEIQAPDFGSAIKGLFSGLKNGVSSIKDKIEVATQQHQVPDAVYEQGAKMKDSVTGAATKAKDKVSDYSENPQNIVTDVQNTGSKIGSSLLKGVNRISEKVTGVTIDPSAVTQTANTTATQVVEKTSGFLSPSTWKENLGKIDGFLKKQEAENNARAEARKGPSPQ